MKENTIIWWLARIKDLDIKQRALYNCSPRNRDKNVSDIGSALGNMCIWSKTKEGDDFWSKLRHMQLPELLDKPSLIGIRVTITTKEDTEITGKTVTVIADTAKYTHVKVIGTAKDEDYKLFIECKIAEPYTISHKNPDPIEDCKYKVKGS